MPGSDCELFPEFTKFNYHIENIKLLERRCRFMSTKLKPLGDRLVVEPQEQEEVTASGLVLPETAKEKPQQGTVIAVGPGRYDDEGERIKMDVALGDVVLYAKYAGTEIKVDGKKVLILKESDVLAIVEK
jgi:chaperonin GroES